ncbi:MAG: class I SAM-dependent methyltransferase [Pseudomonadota bacterium]|jgi:SAM-dependent methyltransferase
MRDAIADAYDRTPYESGCFPFTHPARMGAVARLHGIEAPLPQNCRVLEIGCAMGQNLLPLALQYPQAHFVGVDLSVVQIARAKAAAKELAINNVELLHGDIRALQDQLRGPFDFIICHGVYSWVPPTVRDGILRCCARHLAEHGVVMISFNALPGGCEFRRTRDLVLSLTAGIDASDLPERHRQARATLEKLLRDTGEHVDAAMRSAIQTFIDAPASYAIHEYLSDYNEAFSLGMFAADLEPHGLRYLADAQLDIDGARERLAQRSGLTTRGMSPLALEETLDALVGNAFRRALIVRDTAHHGRYPDLEALRSMAVACRFAEVTEAADGTEITAPMALQTPAGRTLRLLLPAAKDAARRVLRGQPCYVPVASVLADRTSPEAEIVLKTLLRLATEGFVDLVTSPLAIAAELPDPPRLWPWAAYALRSGAGMFCGTTHEPREISPEMRLLAQAINGKTPITELTQRWIASPNRAIGAVDPESSPSLKGETTESPPLVLLLQMLHALGAVA